MIHYSFIVSILAYTGLWKFVFKAEPGARAASPHPWPNQYSTQLISPILVDDLPLTEQNQSVLLLLLLSFRFFLI